MEENKVTIAFSDKSDGSCRFGGETEELRKQSRQNIESFVKKSGFNPDNFFSPFPGNQELRFISKANGGRRPRGQALMTQLKDVPIGIVHCDCLPLLLVDEDKTTIAAIHLSRDYLRSTFLESSIAAMKQKTSSPIEAYIGPCLQQDSHKLDRESVKKLTTARQDIEGFIKKTGLFRKNYTLDYSGYVSHRLEKLGVHTVFNSMIDSYSHEDYDSRRRKIADKIHESNSNMSLICLHN